MTWKPTDEMVSIAYDANHNKGYLYPSHNDMAAALIAVQPFIAAEVWKEAAAICDLNAANFKGGCRSYPLMQTCAEVIRSRIPKSSDNP